MKRKGLLELMDFKLSPENAESVYSAGGEYVLCSAVEKGILILMFYNRRKLQHRRPEVIIFCEKDDYVSVVLTDEGYKWRTGCLTNILDYGMYVENYCTWINKRDITHHLLHDKKQINRYFGAKEDDDALCTIYSFQNKVMEDRLKRKLKKITDKYDEQMKVVPEMPADFAEWVDRVPLAFSRYLVYRKEKKTIKGFCTHCKSNLTLEYAKHNEKGRCPVCETVATYKAKGKAKRIYDSVDCQIIQKVQYDTGERSIIIRYFNVTRNLAGDRIENPEDFIHERARAFYDEKNSLKTYGYTLFRNRELCWNDENVYYNDTGYVYPYNVTEVFKDTKWKYAAIDTMAGHDKPFNTHCFLRNYSAGPAVEYLAKIGLHNMANDLISHGYDDKNIDLKARKIRDVLKIGMEYIPQLKRLDATYRDMKIIKKGIIHKTRLTDEQIRWINSHEGYNDFFRCLKYTTAHKAVRYLDRFKAMQNVIGDWFDYLNMCEKLKYDMSNPFVLFPKDLKKAHDEAAALIEYKKNQKLEKQYKQLIKKYINQFEMQVKGLMIQVPQSLMDIVKEGKALHHCVGTYIERVADAKTVILFIRDAKEPDKSFYTMEVKEGKVIQVRGKSNCDMTPSVKRFVERFKKDKLYEAKINIA